MAVAERFRRQELLRMTADGLRAPAQGDRRVPVESDGSLLINFAAPPDTFPTVSYVRVLNESVPPAVFKDKIVLVGAAVESGDSFFTPFHSRLLPETRRLMSGVEVHANVTDMILRGQYLARASWPWTLGLWLTLGAAAAVLIAWRRPWLALGALVAAVIAQLAGAYACFVMLDVWLAAAGPLMSASMVWGIVLFYGLVTEGRERRFVRCSPYEPRSRCRRRRGSWRCRSRSASARRSRSASGSTPATPSWVTSAHPSGSPIPRSAIP